MLPIPPSPSQLPDAAASQAPALVRSTNEVSTSDRHDRKPETPALPAARGFLASTSPDHPAHAELRTMVCGWRVVRESSFRDSRPGRTRKRKKPDPLRKAAGHRRTGANGRITDRFRRGGGIAVRSTRKGRLRVTLRVTLVRDQQRGTFNTVSRSAWKGDLHEPGKLIFALIPFGKISNANKGFRSRPEKMYLAEPAFID